MTEDTRKFASSAQLWRLNACGLIRLVDWPDEELEQPLERIEAKEVLESQKKVQEQAEEALRLATSRSRAGTGTQLDVLNAQTALTEARTTQVQALHDYETARARLERAIGSVISNQ